MPLYQIVSSCPPSCASQPSSQTPWRDAFSNEKGLLIQSNKLSVEKELSKPPELASPWEGTPGPSEVYLR